MSRIRGKGNTSTELALISIFKELGIIGWRRGSRLKGKPDFVFPKSKIAVFSDGCFWHGHECQRSTPKTHKKYWLPKIARNKKRDIEVSEFLQGKGWRVIRIWECELKKKNRKLLEKKIRELVSQRSNGLLDQFKSFALHFFKKRQQNAALGGGNEFVFE